MNTVSLNVLVCGSTGCVGSAVVRALQANGHRVVTAARGERDGLTRLQFDYAQPRTRDEWAQRLRERGVDAVVNSVGILMPSGRQTYERLHRDGPIELFEGAAKAGVRRVVQISALGVADDAFTASVPYLVSKLRADQALAASGLEWAVLRPSMIFGPGSQSAALFATLASLPVVSLPGGGTQPLAPVHVHDVAACVVTLLESPGPLGSVFELGGPQTVSYREMLQAYRTRLGFGAALWLPLPMALVQATAALAEALPQTVLSRDTMRMLQRGSVPHRNAVPALLGRAPISLADGLAATPPEPWFRWGASRTPPR